MLRTLGGFAAFGLFSGPDQRAGAISTVTTIAYLGFLLGRPP